MVRLLRLVAIGLASCTLATAAAAQSQSRVCAGLTTQLDRLEHTGGSPNAQRYQAAVAQQSAQIDRAMTMSERMHCNGGGLFGPSPSPQCPALRQRIAQMQANYNALNQQLARLQGGDPRVEAQRQNVLAALSQNGCGDQYGGRYAAAEAPRQARPRGLFDLLFGNRDDNEPPPSNGPITLPEEQAPRSSTFRTVCVRKADGFFYPISFATTRNHFQRDADICQRTCPGTPAEMFAYPNPGGSMKDAVSLDGQPYKDLPNAFLYKKKYVPGVSCKPAGETWVQALAGSANRTAASQDQGQDGGNGILADDGRRPRHAVDPNATYPADRSPDSGVTIDGREPPRTFTTAPLDPLH
jgi:hypothetical protein